MFASILSDYLKGFGRPNVYRIASLLSLLPSWYLCHRNLRRFSKIVCQFKVLLAGRRLQIVFEGSFSQLQSILSTLQS